MNYPSSLKYLENLVRFGIKTGVEHTRIISNNLGSPHLKFPSVLIGGTNGKGSTAAYIESILRLSGFKTGLFTSPHLVDIRERIKINNKMVSKNDFAKAITRVKECYEDLKKREILDECPTFFETLTLTSFLIFEEKKVDIAIIEVGMGGKNDCTNILEPTISVVTNVSLDHQKYIGNTIEEIALEKSGIFRETKPAIAGKTNNETLTILKNEASKNGAIFFSYKDFTPKKIRGNYIIKYDGLKQPFPSPPLMGKHQIFNCALAVFTTLKLSEAGFNCQQSIYDGILKCRWGGRIEKISENPDVYLDGAHNIDGVISLKNFAKGVNKKKVALFASMTDKDFKKMLKIFSPIVDEIFFTQIDMKRCAKREDFEKAKLPFNYIFIDDPIAALNEAKLRAGKDGALFVFGSLYLVGYLKRTIENRKPPLFGTGM